MVRLLRNNGLELLDLIEVMAPSDAQDHPRYNQLPATWAQQWPGEEIWRARKPGNAGLRR